MNVNMKRVISSLISVTLCSFLVLGQRTSGTARLKGTVLDVAGAAIPKVQITIQNSTVSFKVVSDDDGKFQIALPPGKYQIQSDKLPGFAATNRELTVETNRTAEVTIVPTVSTEGVLCILTVTGTATTKRNKRKSHR
jgi:uncharacterized membrane protein